MVGYIGESKKPILTYQLITKLFEKSEVRGTDAAGFWGTAVNGVIYHKEPVKASHFVKNDMWKQLFDYNPNLLLVHARGASSGSGNPVDNKNNHPFTNSNKSIALIHNGKIDECEYHTLKQKYNLTSLCDSEILLRMFEAGELYSQEELKKDFGDIEHPERFAGLRDIYSLINEGHMAVAIGERCDNGDRLLWLFRNCHRPLWIIDMRDQLGQVFFISDPLIWEAAIRECSGVRNISRSQKIIELPEDEIWHFKITATDTSPKNVQKFAVYKEKEMTPWKFDGNKIPHIYKPANFEVITILDEYDKIKNIVNYVEKFTENYSEEYPLRELRFVCQQIINMATDIQGSLTRLSYDQSITLQEFNQALLDLDQQYQELKNIKIVIEK